MTVTPAAGEFRGELRSSKVRRTGNPKPKVRLALTRRWYQLVCARSSLKHVGTAHFPLDLVASHPKLGRLGACEPSFAKATEGTILRSDFLRQSERRMVEPRGVEPLTFS